jgi:hypothetical protein
MDPALFKDSVLAALLFVNMIYLGRKIDGLTKAVYLTSAKQKRKARK